MTTQIRLNHYERGIEGALVNSFGYTPEEARRLVVHYVAIIRKLGGYDSCLDHAERLSQADQLGYSPEAWLENIRVFDLEAARDKGIPRIETAGYANVR